MNGLEVIGVWKDRDVFLFPAGPNTTRAMVQTEMPDVDDLTKGRVVSRAVLCLPH